MRFRTSTTCVLAGRKRRFVTLSLHVTLQVVKWLQAAKRYYAFDEHASDACEINQDISSAYKHLAAFETSVERKCKMQRRRIDTLNAVLEVGSSFGHFALHTLDGVHVDSAHFLFF